jgi:hypothetical protein
LEDLSNWAGFSFNLIYVCGKVYFYLDYLNQPIKKMPEECPDEIYAGGRVWRAGYCLTKGGRNRLVADGEIT